MYLGSPDPGYLFDVFWEGEPGEASDYVGADEYNLTQLCLSRVRPARVVGTFLWEPSKGDFSSLTTPIYITFVISPPCPFYTEYAPPLPERRVWRDFWCAEESANGWVE